MEKCKWVDGGCYESGEIDEVILLNIMLDVARRGLKGGINIVGGVESSREERERLILLAESLIAERLTNVRLHRAGVDLVMCREDGGPPFGHLYYVSAAPSGAANNHIHVGLSYLERYGPTHTLDSFRCK